MASTQAIVYRDRSGFEPADDFIERLPPKAAAKIDRAIDEHLNGRAPEAPPPEYPVTSQLAGELRELRVRFARTHYRVLYQRSANLIVLLHALEKHTGAVPPTDIAVAQERFEDFRARMDARPRRPPRAAGQDAPPPGR